MTIGSLLELQERHGQYVIHVYLNAQKISKEELEAAIKKALLVSDISGVNNTQKGAITFHVSLE